MPATKRTTLVVLITTVVLTVVMPVVLGHLLNTYLRHVFVSIPLHSVLETAGGMVAIVISMIFYVKYSKSLVLTHFNWSTGALLAMGIIDIFHASVMPGKMFVWLHSTAVLFGGLFFTAVWFRHRRVGSLYYRGVPLFFLAFALIFSFASLECEAWIPEMLDAQGHFTPLANKLNIIGGVGFFIAALRFLANYLHNGEREEILFAGHTMLFGIAGVLFVSSVIWDMQWWLWHVLRLLAYVIALYFLYIEYRREIRIVERTNERLEEANERIGEYLEIVDRNVIASSTDTRGVITEVSHAFCEISGYSREELLGRSHNIVRHPDMPVALYDGMWRTIKNGVSWHGEIKNRRKDGSSYWVEATITPRYDREGRITGYAAIRHDITDKKRVEVLSVTDMLSGLYNRRHFNETIERELRRCRGEGVTLGLCIMDVDYFKQYNDTYGHQQGDRVIEAVGTLLREQCRTGAYAFRLGGEEFGLLFAGLDAAQTFAYVQNVREKIAALGIEHRNGTDAGVVTVSMGVALMRPGNATDAEALYHEADMHLYDAKEQGRNRVVMNAGATV